MKAFGKEEREKKCSIGTVKSNIGHAESAAGIAAVIKTVMQMRHRELVPSLNTEELNPNIDFEKTPFEVQRRLEKWEATEENGIKYPRIAGISSFGAGGANAHIILKEYPQLRRENAKKMNLFIFSAKSQKSLVDEVNLMIDFLKNGYVTDNDLSDIAYTLQVGRNQYEYRLAVITDNISDLIFKLTSSIESDSPINDVYRGSANEYKDLLNNVFKTSEFTNALSDLLHNNKLSQVAELWAKGVDFDW